MAEHGMQIARGPIVAVEPVAVRSAVAAEMVGLDVKSLKKVPFDELPFYREGRDRRYRVATLRKYAEERERAAMRLGPQNDMIPVPRRRSA